MMRAARMHGYKQPLVLEEIPIPDIGPGEVLVKVGGAGMCRTDFQLIDGYFGKDTGTPVIMAIVRATSSAVMTSFLPFLVSARSSLILAVSWLMRVL